MKTNLNNIKKDYFWNTLGTIFYAFNSLIFLVIVTRINGLEIAGYFSFGLVLSLIFYAIASYGGRNYQITDYKNEFTEKEYVSFRFRTTLITIIIALLFSLLYCDNLTKALIIILLILEKCVESISDVFYGIMQKKGELSTVGKSMFIKSILSLFFFFLLDYLFENVVFSLVAYLFINLLVLIFYDIKKSKYIFSKQTKALSYMKIFRNCFAYFILSFLVNYVYNIPRYVLDINMAPNFQGIFGIIVMPVSVLLLIVQFIIQPQIVNMTKYYESDFPNFKLLIRKIINLVLVFSLISLIAAYFIGIPFLNSIYNVNLDEYKLEFIICLIGGIFYLIVFILLNPLTIMRKGKAQMIIYIINGFISIILSILLISRYLFSGAVISYSVTMILLSVSYCLYYLYMVRGEKV